MLRLISYAGWNQGGIRHQAKAKRAQAPQYEHNIQKLNVAEEAR